MSNPAVAPQSFDGPPSFASGSSSGSLSPGKGKGKERETTKTKTLLGKIGAKGVGAMSGAIATSLLMTPFDVLKTRLQTRRPVPTPSASSSTSRASLCSSSQFSQQQTPSPSSRLAAPHRHHLDSALHRLAYSPAHTGAISSSSSRVVLSDAAALDSASSATRWRALAQELSRSRGGSGFWDEIGTVWRETGVRGFWKGVGTTISMGVPSSAIYMVGYDNLRTYMLTNPTISNSPTLTLLTPLFAGSAARTLSATIISPLELFRTRLQALARPGEPPPSVRGVFLELQEIARTDGVRGVWRGLGATLWRDVPFSGIYWAGYEILKSNIFVGPRWQKDLDWNGPGGRGLGQGEWARAIASGAGSGTLAAFITTPFDVLKTRRQVFTSPSPPLPGSLSPSGSIVPPANVATHTFPLLLHIVRTEGLAALFAGLVPRLAKVAPACAIMVSCYEGVGRWLGGDD